MKLQHKIGLTAGAVLAALCGGSTARADEAGDKLLKTVIAKYKSMKTLSATILTQDMFEAVETLELKKPNVFRMKVVPVHNHFGERLKESKFNVEARPALMVSDGKRYWEYSSDEKTFRVETPPLKFTDLPTTTLFYDPDEFADKSQWTNALVKEGSPSTMASRITGTETVFDVPCRVLEMTFSYYEKPNMITKIHKNYFYVDKNNLVRRIEQTIIHAPDETDFGFTAETVKSMQTDIKLPDADFKFTPPAGAKREK